MPSLAMAADERGRLPRPGLSPGEPQVRSATPSIPFGISPAESKEFVLDFHGYLLLPATSACTIARIHRPLARAARSSIRRRLWPRTSGVSSTRPPCPTPWVQLNFIYGNSTVSGTVILAATTLTDAAGYYDMVDQLGVNDAFITANLTKHFGFPFQLYVGAIRDDMVRWARRMPAATARRSSREPTRSAKTSSRATSWVTSSLCWSRALVASSGGPRPAWFRKAGTTSRTTTWARHSLPGASWRRLPDLARLGPPLHHRLDAGRCQVKGGQLRDGHIAVYGADLHLTAGRAGHLFLGRALTEASNAASVSGAIEILNARGGPELGRAIPWPRQQWQRLAFHLRCAVRSQRLAPGLRRPVSRAEAPTSWSACSPSGPTLRAKTRPATMYSR